MIDAVHNDHIKLFLQNALLKQVQLSIITMRLN